MSDENLLPVLTQISLQLGEVKGLVEATHKGLAQHMLDDTAIQTQIFQRLSNLDVAQAAAAGVVSGAQKVKAWGLATTILTGVAGSAHVILKKMGL